MSQDEREKIELWLGCEDYCAEPESVVAKLPPSRRIVSTLGDGLAPLGRTLRESARRRFAEAYARVADPAISEDAYIEFFLRNMEAVRQKRAAISLGNLGSPAALEELRKALREDSLDSRSYRSDVLRTIHLALVTAEEDPFNGRVPSGARFLDTAIVQKGSLDFDGNVAVTLHGAPFPDDLLLARWSDSLAFLAVGEVGSYALSVTNLGSADVRQVDTFTITSFEYSPHATATAENLATGPLPRRVFSALTTDARDDYFRFQPAQGTSVTAIADWRGPAQVVLLFDVCSAFAADSGDLAATVLNERGDPLEGVHVTVPMLALGAITNARGGVRLSGLPVAAPAVLDLRFAVVGYILASARARVGTADLIVTLVASPDQAPQYANPDSVSASVPGDACWMMRLHRFDAGDELAIVRLRVTP